MRLTFEDIKKIAVGAIKITEEANGIHFYKCTEKQQKAWAALKDILGYRALTTSGVRLDFHTNSKTIRFSASEGELFELCINGVHRKLFKMAELREKGELPCAEITDPLGYPLDEARVTLYFPAHSVGVLEYLELDDGATVVPHKFDRKMLFIGDSITQGWDSTYDSMSYAQNVSAFFNAESVIHGVGGGYFHETVFDSIDFKPDTVVVAFGTNDFGHFKTIEEFNYHCSVFLDNIAAEYADAENGIFVLSPLWRGDYSTANKPMGSFKDCRQVVIDNAKRLGLRHIDGLELVPPCVEFMADGCLHPNTAGFGQYALNLIRKMTQA